MSLNQPIQPQYGSGQSIAVGAATTGTLTLAIGTKQLRIVNIGANLGYYRIGKSGMAACTTADVALGSGVGEVVTRSSDDDTFGYYSLSGTTFHVIPCEGE